MEEFGKFWRWWFLIIAFGFGRCNKSVWHGAPVGTQQLTHSASLLKICTNLESVSPQPWYCWWFRNPAPDRSFSRLACYLQGLVHPRWCKMFNHQQYLSIQHNQALIWYNPTLDPLPKTNSLHLRTVVSKRFLSFSRGLFSGRHLGDNSSTLLPRCADVSPFSAWDSSTEGGGC